jgi:hypothetical protein
MRKGVLNNKIRFWLIFTEQNMRHQQIPKLFFYLSDLYIKCNVEIMSKLMMTSKFSAILWRFLRIMMLCHKTPFLIHWLYFIFFKIDHSVMKQLHVFRKESFHPKAVTVVPPTVRENERVRSLSPRPVQPSPGSPPPQVSARNQPPCWRSRETTPCSSSFKASSGPPSVHCVIRQSENSAWNGKYLNYKDL